MSVKRLELNLAPNRNPIASIGQVYYGKRVNDLPRVTILFGA